MYDVVIIGCGVTGAAMAYELARYDLHVAVTERANDVAMGCSKANSAIIHAGYDPRPGSLVARLNVEGCAMAGPICEKLDVPYRRIGSLVVAFSQKQKEHLQKLFEQGTQNGVPCLELLDGEQARAMEPQLSPQVCGALYAPSAGIINPWEYTLAMAEVAVHNGVELFLNTEIVGIEKAEGGGFLLQAGNGRRFRARFVINAAGVQADRVHEMVGEKEFTINPTRGEYYLLDKNEGGRVHHVIFPCPTELGKGVLVSPTVHGNLIVGPNAEAGCGREENGTTAAGLRYVREMAKQSVPSLDFGQNIRNFAGVRPNTEFEEFCVGESKTAKGFLNLAGVRSPGLTAAPALARYAAQLLQQMGLSLSRKPQFVDGRKKTRFVELSPEQQNQLIRQDARFGRVICRCETVTEGEIVQALHSTIPARSVNGVKRRAGNGMGRCQGGFCEPRVAAIIARELGIPLTEVLLEDAGSELLTGRKSEVQV